MRHASTSTRSPNATSNQALWARMTLNVLILVLDSNPEGRGWIEQPDLEVQGKEERRENEGLLPRLP